MKRSCHILVTTVCLLLLLAACGAAGDQMRQQLSELEEQNRSGEQMLNDSLAERLVAYFDRHGTPNERMRARYMLGRTYFDLGELPRALEVYFTARDCADTTAADCDYRTLSRIHAQSARVFQSQVQPRSRLKELRIAQEYAKRGNDTLMAIDCYTLQSEVYDFLRMPDSVISIVEEGISILKAINRPDRASQLLGSAISALIDKGDVKRSKAYIDVYEINSGFFDSERNIKRGMEIYYYIKGCFYLNNNNLDSAEYMFRKELLKGENLNNQIAGCKGLQELYTRKGNLDSIAKYACLSYELNDSAYSLSEMENIQRLSASYNYEHNKQVAIEKTVEADRANMRIFVIIALVLICTLLSVVAFSHYKHRIDNEFAAYQKDMEILAITQAEVAHLHSQANENYEVINQQRKEIKILQERIELFQQRKIRAANNLEQALAASPIVSRLHDMSSATTPQRASNADIRELTMMINERIPSFYSTVNRGTSELRQIEYEVCLLTRCHFRSADICRLLNLTDSYIANLKKGILLKAFNLRGVPKDFDQKILSIK